VGEFLTLDSHFSSVNEWVLENLLAEFKFSHPRHSKSLKSYPVMYVRIKASRKWRTYLTLLVITLFMSALGLGAFALPLRPDELGNRLNYCVIFLLADVSTIQLVFEKLPRIQYTTIMEEYTISCFFFLVAITGWSCVAGAYEYGSRHDHLAFIVFLTIFLVFQAFTVLRAAGFQRWEREKLTKSSTELKHYIERNVCCYVCLCDESRKDFLSLHGIPTSFLRKIQESKVSQDWWLKANLSWMKGVKIDQADLGRDCY